MTTSQNDRSVETPCTAGVGLSKVGGRVGLGIVPAVLGGGVSESFNCDVLIDVGEGLGIVVLGGVGDGVIVTPVLSR